MNAGDYFLVLTLVVFFMLLFVYVSWGPAKKEYFVSNPATNTLLPADKVVYVQGNGIPDTPLMPSSLDVNDPSAQSVDGTPEAPKSIFTFAYNQCDPSCCEDSAYSCQGGCVCMTENQKKYFSGNKCSL